MRGSEIWHQVPIKAAPSDVFAALTQPELLGKWWMRATGNLAIGGMLTFHFNEDFSQEMAVLEVETDSRILWQPRDTGLGDWIGSKIEFTLKPTDNGTNLQFRHFDYKQDVPGFPYYSQSWATYMLSLRAFIETGTCFTVSPDGSLPKLAAIRPALAA